MVDKSSSFPEHLGDYDAILLFSNSTSSLTEEEIDRLITYVENGGGLYSGSENWPLQAESNLVTQELYKKESFGDFAEKSVELNTNRGNLELSTLEELSPGTTTVAFPMDYRLKVEAWVGDQPLISTGTIGMGRIIIDGGYSRFYCEHRTLSTDKLWGIFIDFLTGY